MMEDTPPTYSVKEASLITGMSVSMIRNWSGEDGMFANYLSEQAAAPSGQERRYTASDLEILYTVARKRKIENVSYDAIADFIAAGNRIELPDSIPAPDSQAKPAGAVAVAEDARPIDLARAILSEANDMHKASTERIRELEKTVDRLQAELRESETKRAMIAQELADVRDMISKLPDTAIGRAAAKMLLGGKSD